MMSDEDILFYAELDKNNYVLRVICVNKAFCLNSEGIFEESLGSKWCADNLGGYEWVQTFTTKNFRKNYAGIGDYFDKEKNAFIAPRPYDNWVFNEEHCIWIPPIPKPLYGNYYWNQELGEWKE